MTESWSAAIAFSAVAVAVAWGTLLIARVMSVKAKNPPPTRELTYECGEEPDGDAWVRFHPRYYLVALVFVIFDVETAFILPWALNLGGGAGEFLLVEMAIFVGVLLLGWAYAVRKGALTWQ